MENYSYNSSSYPESGHSSPRSREIDFENTLPWEDAQNNQPPTNYQVKFMCSYGGKIHPRPNDNQLSYIGGETKILSVDRNVKFGTLLSKLAGLCDSEAISFKYQLPGEDLDALISVTNDDDLEHMMHEYDRLFRVPPKPARLRIFIFRNPNPNPNTGLDSSAQSFGSDEGRTEKERFVEALNSGPIIAPVQQSASPAVGPAQMQQPQGNVDFLFGLEKGNASVGPPPAHQPDMGRAHNLEDTVVPPGLDKRSVATDPIQKHIQDLQRLRIEEQQGLYRRKSDDNFSGGPPGAEYFNVPENKISQVTVADGVPYWTEKQVPGGVFPASTAVSNEQPIYMIPSSPGAYHSPIVRPVSGAPSQGYYTVQRIPSDVYRDQQQIYSMIPPGATAPPHSMPPQGVAGYPDGFHMGRPANTGGVAMVTESGYAHMGFDNGQSRQVIYSSPPGMMAAQASQYHQVMAGAVSAETRQNGALTAESTGKIAKNQASI